MAVFIPGRELNRLFFAEAVKPLLDAVLPDLRYAAALIGPGSDVLGFDTAQSTDHYWGPRLWLLLPEDRLSGDLPRIDAVLREGLPRSFRGYATNFGPPDAIGVRLQQPTDEGPVAHLVQITTVRTMWKWNLGVDPEQLLTPVDWLTFAEQRLRSLTGGVVYYDNVGELSAARKRLEYYPHDVWLYLLAAQWGAIGQTEAFMARCGDVGDDLGSRLIGAQIVELLMKLAFLLERQYAPYTKWFGSAFAQLACAAELQPALAAVLTAGDWHDREAELAKAYGIVAGQYNALGIGESLSTDVRPYFNRPYLVLRAERFAQAAQAAIDDTTLRQMPLIGGVDQFIKSTDVLTHPDRLRRLGGLFQ